MKQLIILFIFFFKTIPGVCQTEKQKLEQLKAQMQMIQQTSDSMLKVLQKVKGKQAPATSPITADADQFKPRLNSFETITLRLPDSAKIRLIPKKILSVEELGKYLVDLYKLMRVRFPAGSIKLADDIANQVGRKPQQLEAAASVAWLNGYTTEAALLIMEGASLNGNDGLLLTNAGAILDLAGLGYKAVPILRTLVSVNPENAIASNNLGQAYCGLGLYDSAMLYLNGCIKLSPEHPEANNTAGFIEFKRGNKGAAKTYFENSIRGGFNGAAYRGLRSIDKNDKENWKIKKLIRPKVTYPEYFNQYKFKLPKQCENIEEAEKIESEQKGFIDMVRTVKNKYNEVLKEQQKVAANTMMVTNMANMQKAREGKAYMRPFQLMASIMQQEIMEDLFSQKPTPLSRFNEDNRSKLKSLQEQYDKEYDLVSSDCKASNTLKNKYLPQFAALNNDWQIKNIKARQEVLEDMLFWMPMAALNKESADAVFYESVAQYLTAVEKIAYENIILKPCNESGLAEATEDSALVLKDFDCPFTISKSLVVADFEIDCEKVSVKLNFLVANFKMDRSIKTRQTTMSIGIGGNMYNKGFNIGSIKASGSLDGSMSLYLTVDPSGFNDAGMIYSATASASVAFEKGKRFESDKELKKISVGASYRIGINSGLDIRDAEGRDLLAPTQEKPLNKNVKVYPQK
jgi:tetratricopeptide (TPR) repeat protein